jgi:hypothetical protein
VPAYLKTHPGADAGDLTRACLAGASAGWLERVAADLDWLGYVVAFRGPDGGLAALQITDRGLRQVASIP